MSQHSIKALLYFPTTVLFIDDDPVFLSLTSLQIHNRIPVVLSDKPKQALELLLNCTHINDLIQKTVRDLQDNECSPEGDIYNLYKIIYNELRFSFISTVIVDYSMPNLNGAELCEQIAHLPITKIMLTAEADHQKAVQLFNNKHIDYFIIKDSQDMNTDLNKVIQKAQLTYFEQASSLLFNELCKRSEYFKQNHGNKIADLISDGGFSEYYLLDNSGSMLLLDFNSKPSWLVIKSDQEIESYFDIAINQDTPETVLRLLKDKALPFFFNPADYKIPAAGWEPYLHQGNELPGSKDFRYALIKNSSLYQLDNCRIVSHKNYLQK
ncbi:MAG: response regulator [Tatlockia sp.]|nr:response regulator [Tatlockia sp.]